MILSRRFSSRVVHLTRGGDYLPKEKAGGSSVCLVRPQTFLRSASPELKKPLLKAVLLSGWFCCQPRFTDGFRPNQVLHK
jgi:hypothetical protein